MSEFRKRDIAKILKESPRNIEFWAAEGLVVPDVEVSQGRGKPNKYSKRNLVEFGMIELLSRMGVSLERIRHILEILRKGEWNPPGDPFPSLPKDSAKKAILLKEWQKYNNVQFKDFWTSPEWGFTKELVFRSISTVFWREKLYKNEWFIVLEKKEDEPEFPSIDQAFINLGGKFKAADVDTVIWLGSIRNNAMELVLG
jgi:DNA-binding transcriptional MerR regulator